MDSAVAPYTPTAHMNSLQSANDLYLKPCKVADICDKSTLNDIFIENVDLSTSERF